MATNTKHVRIDYDVVKDLKQYCLDKYGKIQGMMVLEASEAIKNHINGGGEMDGK